MYSGPLNRNAATLAWRSRPAAIMWAASASARASKSAQVSTRSPWMKAGRSGWMAAIASQTSAKVQELTAILPKRFFSLGRTWRRRPEGSQRAEAGSDRQGGGELDLLH